jgi:hypothetical protein
LVAVSLAGSNLAPTSLSSLLPALTALPCFKLLDLSHNPSLFSTQPDALPILRKNLPKLNTLRKLQLAHASMLPDHAPPTSDEEDVMEAVEAPNEVVDPVLRLLVSEKADDEEASASYVFYGS